MGTFGSGRTMLAVIWITKFLYLDSVFGLSWSVWEFFLGSACLFVVTLIRSGCFTHPTFRDADVSGESSSLQLPAAFRNCPRPILTL